MKNDDLGVNMRLTQGAEPITRKQPGEPGPSQWQILTTTAVDNEKKNVLNMKSTLKQINGNRLTWLTDAKYS